MIKYNQGYSLKPFGLNNTGVICYFNSMLQCFLSCTSVIELFHKDKKLQSNNLLCASIWNMIKKSKRDFDISCLGPALWQQFTSQTINFGHGQEDAHEGFIRFLECINYPALEQLFQIRYKSYRVCLGCNVKKELQSDTNVYVDFDRSHIANNDINLNRRITLMDTNCAKCDCQIKKYDTLCMVSEVIIFLLKKYDSKWVLDLPKEFSINGIDSRMTYKLIAVSEHSGTTSGGHYWANCERQGGAFNLNDNTESSISSVSSSANTYMAWYHLV